MIGMHVIKKYSVLGEHLSEVPKLFPRETNIQTETPEVSEKWIGQVVVPEWLRGRAVLTALRAVHAKALGHI